MTVRAILSAKGGEVVSVTPHASVVAAVQLLSERRIGAVPVVERGATVGIFSERDVMHCLAKEGAAALNRRVGDVMTAPAVTVDVDSAAITALGLMTRRRIRHLPVVEGDAMVGFISIGDLVKYRIDRIEHEASSLRDYIAS